MPEIFVGQMVKYTHEEEGQEAKELTATVTAIHEDDTLDLTVDLDDSGNKMNMEKVSVSKISVE